MSRRAYCRCTTVRNYSYEEAAEKLRCNQRWLEDNIGRLPHQKIGACPAFCDCELALIQAMCTVTPADLHDLIPDAPGPQAAQAQPERVPALMAIRPAGARQRSAAL